MKKQFMSIRPKTGVVNQCSRCGKFYDDKDVIILEDEVTYLNCLDTKNPKDINKMLMAKLQQEDIMAIQHAQYGIDV